MAKPVVNKDASKNKRVVQVKTAGEKSRAMRSKRAPSFEEARRKWLEKLQK